MSESALPSGPQLIASGRESADPSCSLCYCFRLLGQSILPQTYCFIDSPFAIQSILLHRVCLIQTSTLQAGNRSPPQA